MKTGQGLYRVFLCLVLGVFLFNHVAELVDHHSTDSTSICCEINEFEEFSELNTKLKALESASHVLLRFHFNFIQDLLSGADGISRWSFQRAFFPHAHHVPVYLDKGVFIV